MLVRKRSKSTPTGEFHIAAIDCGEIVDIAGLV